MTHLVCSPRGANISLSSCPLFHSCLGLPLCISGQVFHLISLLLCLLVLSCRAQQPHVWPMPNECFLCSCAFFLFLFPCLSVTDSMFPLPLSLFFLYFLSFFIHYFLLSLSIFCHPSPLPLPIGHLISQIFIHLSGSSVQTCKQTTHA